MDNDQMQLDSEYFELSALLERADHHARKEEFELAEILYQDVIKYEIGDNIGKGIHYKEMAIFGLTDIWCASEQNERLKEVVEMSTKLFSLLPKATTARIIRVLLDRISILCSDPNYSLPLCEYVARWCASENRSFLRLRVELRIANIYLLKNEMSKGLSIVDGIYLEAKRLDDKMLLVETHLVQSKLYFACGNIPKSKASLTAARTHANSIHFPPALGGDIDMLTAIIAADEKDFEIAYSYFFEAFEAFNALSNNISQNSIINILDKQQSKSIIIPRLITRLNENRDNIYIRDDVSDTNMETIGILNCNRLAVSTVQDTRGIFWGPAKSMDFTFRSFQAYKYMLICKLMTGNVKDIYAGLSSKHGLKFADHPDSHALRELADAYSQRSSKMLDSVMRRNPDLLHDAFMARHLNNLVSSQLEACILRTLEPYDLVKIDYISNIVDIPSDQLTRKLETMILDKSLRGILDQGRGMLILFDKLDSQDAWSHALAIIQNLSNAMDKLYEKAQTVI